MLYTGCLWTYPTRMAVADCIRGKKDGTLQLSVDYGKLDGLKICDSYLIPRMDQCIDLLKEATIFSTLDAYSRYCKVGMAREYRDETAFTSNYGLFRFRQMRFRLKKPEGRFIRQWGSYLPRWNGSLPSRMLKIPSHLEDTIQKKRCSTSSDVIILRKCIPKL